MSEGGTLLSRVRDVRHGAGELASPMVSSSLGMVGGKAAAMGLGFVFWLLAARLLEPQVVGLAAAVVSAVMLCVQLANLGIGSAFVRHYPAHRDDPAPLLDTSFAVVTWASTVAAGLFLGVASFAFDELRSVTSDPVFAVAFVVTVVVGATVVVVDQVSMAQRQGRLIAVRNAVNGGLTILMLLVATGVLARVDAVELFVCWVAGAVAAALVGYWQLRRGPLAYRFRAEVRADLRRMLLRSGLMNHLLTLTERTPHLVLPVLVTEMLSAEANAYWFAAWMTAWAVYAVPLSVGTAVFAEVSHDPADLAEHVRHAVRFAGGLGLVAAVGAGVTGDVVLGLMGPDYATNGVAALRILVVAVVPLTLTHVYIGVCRAIERLREAILAGTVAAVAAVSVMAAAGTSSGLTAMAVAWLVVQIGAGLWAWWRLGVIVAAAATRPARTETID